MKLTIMSGVCLYIYALVSVCMYACTYMHTNSLHFNYSEKWTDNNPERLWDFYLDYFRIHYFQTNGFVCLISDRQGFSLDMRMELTQEYLLMCQFHLDIFRINIFISPNVSAAKLCQAWQESLALAWYIDSVFIENGKIL